MQMCVWLLLNMIASPAKQRNGRPCATRHQSDSCLIFIVYNVLLLSPQKTLRMGFLVILFDTAYIRVRV